VILVLDYDPAWADEFVRLRSKYEAALRHAGVVAVSIEHVGSTVVPGLAAKPVIDCDIVVRGEDVAAASSVLVGLGFEPRGEQRVPQRGVFLTPDDLPPTHTYVVPTPTSSWRDRWGCATTWPCGTCFARMRACGSSTAT
jgi:GrpB-like predicted nucleotidyltransferase (UPF0157 family)